VEEANNSSVRELQAFDMFTASGPIWQDFYVSIGPILLIQIYYIVSGGFAIVQPDSQLSINAVEGFPLEDFSADVRSPSNLVDFKTNRVPCEGRPVTN
jgi:hypothetical protein